MTMTYQVTAADLAEQQVACVRGRILLNEIPAFLSTAYQKVATIAAEQGLSLSGPPYARYRFEGSTLDIDAGFPVTGEVTRSGDVEAGSLPGGRVLSTLHVGAYDELANAYDALMTHLTEDGYEPAGAAWESYLDGPDVPQPRTRVFQPVQNVDHRRMSGDRAP